MSPNNPRHQALRLATYNIQAGIGSRRRRHMLTHSIRYLVPHRHVQLNLDRIAERLSGFDVVGLQEADAGSYRTRYIHQAHYLAAYGHFPYWHSQITREMGRIARMSCSMLSKMPWERMVRHRLPASRHGRVALEVIFRVEEARIALFITHLSLSRASRMRQVRFLAQRINRHSSAVLMGDLNCDPESREFSYLLSHTRLQNFVARPYTFPSWKPRRSLDHILVTDDLLLEELRALPLVCSDHLPLAASVRFRRGPDQA